MAQEEQLDYKGRRDKAKLSTGGKKGETEALGMIGSCQAERLRSISGQKPKLNAVRNSPSIQLLLRITIHCPQRLFQGLECV